MSSRVFFPLQFLDQFKKDSVNSYLNVWQNSPVKPSCPGLLFVGSFFFFNWFNFITADWSVYIFYFFLVQSWETVRFQEFVHFFQLVHWCLFFIGIQLFIIISYDPSYFCSFSCKFSFFISDFIDFGPLSFFLGSGLRFTIFAYCFKEPIQFQ